MASSKYITITDATGARVKVVADGQAPLLDKTGLAKSESGQPILLSKNDFSKFNNLALHQQAAAYQKAQQAFSTATKATPTAPTAPTAGATPIGTGTSPQVPQQNPGTAAPAIKSAEDYLADIKKGAGAGSFGEGQFKVANEVMGGLKDQLKQGAISVTDYTALAEKIVPEVMKSYVELANAGSSSATAAKNAGADSFTNAYADKSPEGDFVPKIPLSRTEYAKLPDSALPTQADVDKGLFDPGLAPIERYRTETPATPTPTDGPIVPPQEGQTTNSGLKELTDTKPGLDARTDAGKLENEGARQAEQLLAVLAEQQKLREQGLDKLKTSAGEIDAQRKQRLDDLAGILNTQQMDAFNRSIPALAEHANTRGIYRSTGFGDILANKFTDLEKDRQTQFGLQGLQDRDAYLNQLAGIANTGYGIQDQYASGLADVANTKLGFQTSGLQRNFSLEDYQRQANDLAKYGSAPTAPSSSMGKGAGALSGAATGAAAGSAIPGVGTAIGAGVGLVAGGALGGKK